MSGGPGQEVAHLQHLIELERWREAAALATRLLAVEPDHPRLNGLLAQAQLGLDDPAGALEAGNRQVVADPDNEWGHRICSIALSRLGHQAEAARAATEAVRLAPFSWQTHAQLAATGGSQFYALEAARRAVELAPLEADAHFGLGAVLQARKDAEQARTAYLEALRLDPVHGPARNNLTLLNPSYRLGERARGFSEALRHDPQSQTVRGNLEGLAVRFMRRLYWSGLVTLVLALIVGGVTGRPVSPASVVLGCGLLAFLGWSVLSARRTVSSGVFVHLSHQFRSDAVLAITALVSVVVIALALTLCFTSLLGGIGERAGLLRVVGLLNLVVFGLWRVRNRGR